MSGRRWLNRGAVYTRERGGAMASRCGSERLRHPPRLPCLRANEALLLHNARLAAELAAVLAGYA